MRDEGGTADEQQVTFHTLGGAALAGVFRPATSGSSPAPAVLLCQGLSGVKHLVLPQIAEAFAAHGMASLRFDYAGCGESEGARGWIDPRRRVDDAHHAYAWLAAQPSVDADRIGVYGHSYGGPVAIHVAVRDPRVRAVVSVSGPGSGIDMLRAVRASWDWVAFRRRLDEERAAVATGGTSSIVPVQDIFPFSPAFLAAYAELEKGGGTSAMETGPADALGVNQFFLDTVSAMLDFHPEDAARRLGGCPLLLVHGQDDDTAPVETIGPVYAAAPGPKRQVVLPGLAHNDLDAGAGLATAIELAAAWFTEHLTAM